MATLLARSILTPLKLAPGSFAKIHVLLSPSLGGQDGEESRTQNGEGEVKGNGHGHQTASAPYLPSSMLPALVKQCPSLAGSFAPSPHLPTGHLQTIYSTLANTVDTDVVHYTRTVLLLPESGIISLDVCDNEPENQDEKRATVVILHGLTGGSQES